MAAKIEVTPEAEYLSKLYKRARFERALPRLTGVEKARVTNRLNATERWLSRFEAQHPIESH